MRKIMLLVVVVLGCAAGLKYVFKHDRHVIAMGLSHYGAGVTEIVAMLRGSTGSLGLTPPGGAQDGAQASAAPMPSILSHGPHVFSRSAANVPMPVDSHPAPQAQAPAESAAAPLPNGIPRGVPVALLKYISPSMVTTNANGQTELTPSGEATLRQIMNAANPSALKDQLAGVGRALRSQ